MIVLLFLPPLCLQPSCRQVDLRADRSTVAQLREAGREVVTPEEGAEVAGKIGAAAYRECSALTRLGVDELFQEAIRIALQDETTKKRKKRCTLL